MEPAEVQDIVGRNVQRVRRERQLTQEQLADRSGYAQQKLSDVENGKTSATLYTLYRLARALEVSVAELVRGL